MTYARRDAAVRSGDDVLAANEARVLHQSLRDKLENDHANLGLHLELLSLLYSERTAIAFEDAVNVTLGLPFIRTSPDHGTAFDIAGSGRANPSSLVAALRLAARMAAAKP